MNEFEIKSLIRDVKDFPVKGIIFKDLTPVFANADALHSLAIKMSEQYRGMGITKVVGIESRGFILGSIIANELEAGFVPIRKPGKLPSDIISERYEKEYGFDTIEMHRDGINSDDIVLIHDDLLATGGTMAAALRLVNSMHPKAVYINFITELEFLHGRDAFPAGTQIDTLIPL